MCDTEAGTIRRLRGPLGLVGLGSALRDDGAFPGEYRSGAVESRSIDASTRCPANQSDGDPVRLSVDITRNDSGSREVGRFRATSRSSLWGDRNMELTVSGTSLRSR